jgi:hypothetical protein
VNSFYEHALALSPFRPHPAERVDSAVPASYTPARQKGRRDEFVREPARIGATTLTSMTGTRNECWLSDRKNSPIRPLFKITRRIAPRFLPGLSCIKLSQILHKNGAAENPAALLPIPADDLS